MNRALTLASIVLGLAIAGCGGDESGQTTAPEVSIPAVTAPIAPTATTPVATGFTTESTTTPTTTTTTKGGNTFDPKQPDSETNDLLPPAGSPQEAFEKQCEQNPEACG